MVYMITYDLNGDDKQYDGVISAIENCAIGEPFSQWQSSYLIKSNLQASGIWRKIRPYLDDDDTLIIIEVTNNYKGWLTKADWRQVKSLFG